MLGRRRLSGVDLHVEFLRIHRLEVAEGGFFRRQTREDDSGRGADVVDGVVDVLASVLRVSSGNAVTMRGTPDRRGDATDCLLVISNFL